MVIISFYKEKPGGWKLDFKDETGSYIAHGDRWVETLDDLVLQIGNKTSKDLDWQVEDDDNFISFYQAIRQCVTT